MTAFQVSVDGRQRIHDQRRTLANGEGTYARIWRNLLDMRDWPDDFTVVIRCNIDRNNLHDAGAFVTDACAAFSGDPRFKLFIRSVGDLGGPNGGTLALLSPPQMARLGELRQYAKSLGAALTSDDEEYVCYAAKSNSFVIRSDGRIGKCTVALDDPGNDVGRLGDDGILMLDRDKVRVWTRGQQSGDSGELSCPMRATTSHAGRAAPRPTEPAIHSS